MSATPKIDYTARDYDTNLSALKEFIRVRYPTIWNSLFEGDLGTVLLELISYDFSILSYILDMQTQECFLDTLSLRESLLHFARLTGYEVKRASPAAIELAAEVTSAPGAGSSFLIRKGERVRSRDGQVWEVQSDHEIPESRFYPVKVTAEFGSIQGRVVSEDGEVSTVNAHVKLIAGTSTAVLCDETGARLSPATNFGQLASQGSILKLTRYLDGTVPNITHDEYAIIEVGKFEQDLYGDSVLFLDRPWDQPQDFVGEWRIENRNILVTQGESFTEEFDIPVTEDERKSYSLQASRYPVIGAAANTSIPSGFFGSTKAGGTAAGVTVLVNGMAWTQTSSLLFETGDSLAYETDVDEFDRLTLKFGDGVFGAILPSEAKVVVQYRVGGGAQGNLPQNSFDTTLVASNLNDPTQPVTVYITNPYTVGRGGADRETIQEAKRAIPQFVRTNDRAVTVEDYAYLASNFQDPVVGRVKLAKGILHKNTVPREQNVVWVYTWVEGESGQLTAPSLTLKARLSEYLNQRKMITDEVVVVDGVTSIVPVALRYRIQKSADHQVVQGKVQVAINQVFAKLKPGETLYLSSLYQAIEAVDEIDFVNIMEPKQNMVAGSQYELFTNTLQILPQTKLLAPAYKGGHQITVASTVNIHAKSRVMIYEADKEPTPAIVDSVASGIVTLRSDYPLSDNYSTEADVVPSDYLDYHWSYERQTDVFVRFTSGVGTSGISEIIAHKIRAYMERTLRPEENLLKIKLELLVRAIPNVISAQVTFNTLDNPIEQIVPSSREKITLGSLTINNSLR